jgi:putative DNA primase/helicase
VTANETDDKARLNEARVKSLTGGDTLTARLLHKEFFQFRPIAKFWLAFNHKPRVADDSHGFWRRVRLIPFLHRFTEAEADKHLLDKLRAEAPGILAWAVRGCLDWQAKRLGMPSSVRAATEAYREESDPLSGFLAEKCLIDPATRAPVGELWAAFDRWQGEYNRERWTLDRRSFNQRMEKRFEKRRHGHARDRYWFGVCLRTNVETPGTPSGADMRTDADADLHISPTSRTI